MQVMQKLLTPTWFFMTCHTYLSHIFVLPNLRRFCFLLQFF